MDLIPILAQILPVLASVYFIVVLLIHLYINIRRKFPIKVNCWFCNCWTKVPYNEMNCFYCTICDQYNGFTEDGGYNKVIPEQHDELLNYSARLKSTNPPSNGLCAICNNNQLLKVIQLAKFVPMVDGNFDAEIEHFQAQLDNAYKLCRKCDQTLKQTIEKQNAQIFGKHLKEMQRSRKRTPTVTKFKQWTLNWLKFCQFFGAILTFIVFIITLYRNQIFSKQIFSYISHNYTIILQDTAKKLRFIEIPPVSPYLLHSIKIETYSLLCSVGLILQMLPTLRIKSFVEMNRLLCWTILLTLIWTKLNSYSIYLQIPATGYLVLSTMLIGSRTKTIKMKKSKRRSVKRNPQPLDEYSDQELEDTSLSSQADLSCHNYTASTPKNNSFTASPLVNHEIHKSLNDLHLGTPGYSPKSRPSLQRPKPVLSPPKFINHSPNSWVAGGFWRNHDGLLHQQTNLSRASSESSGIGSQHNEFYQFSPNTNPQNNSVLSENIERNSLISEPAYYFKPMNGNLFDTHTKLRNINTFYPNLHHNNMLLIQGNFSRLTTPSFVSFCNWPDKVNNQPVQSFRDLSLDSSWN